MKSSAKAIVFENFAAAHLGAALLYRLRGDRVLYLRSNWEGAARFAARLSLKEPLYLRSNPAGDKAFVFTDSVYETLFRRHPLIAVMGDLYQEERIHFIYKKYLNMLLEQHFHYLYLEERIQASLPAGTEISFVPERAPSGSLPPVTGANLPPWSLPFLKGEGLEKMTPAFPLKIPRWFRARGRVLEVIDLARVLFETLALCTWKFLFGRRASGPRPSYPFAVAIITPLREFANPFRGYDMLLDGERIRKENTLFVPMAHLTPEQWGMLEGKGLAVAEMRGRPSRALFSRMMRAGWTLLLGIWKAPWWIGRVSAYSLRDYGIWKSFLERYDIRHFITYNELSFRPVARNLLLNREGVQTWYFADTVNTSNIYLLRPGQAPYRQSIWGYLFYDHLISWSESLSEYHQKHRQKIGQYHNVGCLWSEHIRLLREGRLPSPFRKKFLQGDFAAGKKVIAVFDSSYHPDSITNYEDGVAFAEGIARLLDELPELRVVWKEKKARGQLKKLDRALDQAYQKLTRHPRLLFCGHNVAPAEILALCDLAISFPFTSVTVEALGGRVKAIYFDPRDRFRGTYDAQVPGLVTHGFDQMKARVEELLRMGPEAYDAYLDRYALGTLDPYLDGKGLTRFRDLLCGGGAPEGKTTKEIPDETTLIDR